MQARVVRREASLQVTVPSPVCPRNKAAVAMDIVRAWSQLPPTIWKKPSCAASVANWNRRAWPEAEKCSQCSKSFAARKK